MRNMKKNNVLSRAILMATLAHDGQFDRQWQPYILHPLRVMLAAKTEQERVVAVLHDVIEDTEVSAVVLDEEGFSEEIVQAVQALTHVEDESYFAYVERLATNPLARAVKILDLKDNMARKDGLGHLARARLTDRYTTALEYLENIRDNG